MNDDNEIIKLDQLCCSIDKFIELQLKVTSSTAAMLQGSAAAFGGPGGRSRRVTWHQPIEEEKGGDKIDAGITGTRAAGGVGLNLTAVNEA